MGTRRSALAFCTPVFRYNLEVDSKSRWRVPVLIPLQSREAAGEKGVTNRRALNKQHQH